NLANNISIGSIQGGSGASGSVTLGTNVLTVGGNNESTAFGGTISGSGAGTFTKTGTGILALTGTNTFVAAPNLNGGLVNITALANLGAGTAINIDGGGVQYAGLYAALGVDLSARTVNINAGGATFDTNLSTVVMGNPVGGGGAGGFTKSGQGMLALQ